MTVFKYQIGQKLCYIPTGDVGVLSRQYTDDRGQPILILVLNNSVTKMLAREQEVRCV